MKILLVLLRKEFIQIFRNRIILRMILVLPLVQLLILPFAADYQIKNIKIAIVDHDRSPLSRKLEQKITASGYFRLTLYADCYEKALQSVESDHADLIFEIPENFERKVIKENKCPVFVSINAINGMKGGLAGSYLKEILQSFSKEQNSQLLPQAVNIPVIQEASLNWYNPHMNYRFYMVPGIMCIMVTVISGFLTAINIVREREIGTMEQLNVTPIKKLTFILGKLIPFWLLSLFLLSVCLLLAWLVYGIYPVGSIALLYAYAFIYILALEGIGLFVSNFCETQQQVMFVLYFFLMIFILLGGIFTPVASMPSWARGVAACNPLYYFVEVMRMVILKGSAWKDLILPFGITAAMALFFNSIALVTFRKTV